MHALGVMKYVGRIYHCHIVYEGKVIADDHFLVVDEYERPGENGYATAVYCMLMSIRSAQQHEVHSSRLRYSSHYRRMA